MQVFVHATICPDPCKRGLSTKSVTPVQIIHRNSGLGLTERQKEIFKDNDVTPKEDEKFVQKLRMRKIGFKKDLPANSQLRIVFSEL